VYKFQTSRGPDQDAEGIEGGREWGGGVPLSSRLGGLGENFGVKNTPDRHKFLGDLAGRIETPGGPDCGQRAVCWTLLL